MKKLILASSSPRRKALLAQMGLSFDVVASHYDEKFNLSLSPHKLVQSIAKEKAKIVARKHKDSIIIAADTMIIFQKKIIGKPKNAHDAKRILKLLSGKTHKVITGFTIIHDDKIVVKSDETTVYFREITNEEIDRYIGTGESLDKAGAYGINERGGIFIKKIVGDYFNVVGLPLFLVLNELKKLTTSSWPDYFNN